MNGISISNVGDDPDLIAEWSEYVANHCDATVYHDLAWRSIFEKSFGYRSWMLMAHHEHSGQVVGVLPLYLVRGFGSSRLVSVPFRDRGGPLWTDESALDRLLSSAKALQKETGASSLVLKSIDSWPEGMAIRHGFKENHHWIRSLVLLDSMTEEALWKHIGPKTRNMVRQAEARGLSFVDLTGMREAVNVWYPLHLETQKRLGVPPFPRVFFETMLAKLAREDAVRIYGVSRQKNAWLSAMILLREPEMGIYGYSASSREAQQSRANDLMLYMALRTLIAEGCELFDMGSDSPQQSSLLFFKRKWGAVQQRIPSYVYGKSDRGLVDSSSPSYLLARKVFSRMPLEMSEIAGRYLTRRFG